jgi:hypothetical protein
MSPFASKLKEISSPCSDPSDSFPVGGLRGPDAAEGLHWLEPRLTCALDQASIEEICHILPTPPLFWKGLGNVSGSDAHSRTCKANLSIHAH